MLNRSHPFDGLHTRQTARRAFCDRDSRLRRLISDVIRACPKSRGAIAAELSLRLGREVSVRMLNLFTSQGEQSMRFPAAWLPELCEVTGDDRLQREVLSARLLRCLELGEAAARLLGEAPNGLRELRPSMARSEDFESQRLLVGKRQ